MPGESRTAGRLFHGTKFAARGWRRENEEIVMRMICCRMPLVACLFTAVAVFACSGPNRAAGDEPMRKEKSLVGSWEREDKVIVFAADGTGTNNDASRFRWAAQGRPADRAEPAAEWQTRRRVGGLDCLYQGREGVLLLVRR